MSRDIKLRCYGDESEYRDNFKSLAEAIKELMQHYEWAYIEVNDELVAFACKCDRSLFPIRPDVVGYTPEAKMEINYLQAKARLRVNLKNICNKHRLGLVADIHQIKQPQGEYSIPNKGQVAWMQILPQLAKCNADRVGA